jgi:BASS family bile acid:Na+ symporter
MVIFRTSGPQTALVLGLLVSQRNMGLMLAATDGALPGLTWLYFALCQFPIYLSPQLLKPIAKKLREQQSGKTDGVVEVAGQR